MKRQIFLLKWVVLLVFLFPTVNATAQNNKPYLAYATLEGNFGTYEGFSMQLHYVSADRYSVALGFTSSKRDTWIPADYRPGLTFAFDFDQMGFPNKPIDYHTHMHVLGGKVFYLSKSGFFRLNMMSGLGLGIFRDVENWTYNTSANDIFANPYAPLFPNYDYDFTYRLRPSVMLQPKLEMVFHENFGLSVSPLAQFNTHRSYYGFTVGFVAGKLK